MRSNENIVENRPWHRALLRERRPRTHTQLGCKGSQHSLQPLPIGHCWPLRPAAAQLRAPIPVLAGGDEALPGVWVPESPLLAPRTGTHQLRVAALPVPVLLCSLQQTERWKSAHSLQGRHCPTTATPAARRISKVKPTQRAGAAEQLGGTFWAVYSTSRMVLSSSTQASSSSPLPIRSCRTGTAMRSSRSRHSAGRWRCGAGSGHLSSPH